MSYTDKNGTIGYERKGNTYGNFVSRVRDEAACLSSFLLSRRLR